MSDQYYVPMYSNFQGEVSVPTVLLPGTVAFYSPQYPIEDEWCLETHSPYKNTIPAFWIVVKPTSRLYFKGNTFVLLGGYNTIGSTRISDASIHADKYIAEFDKQKNTNPKTTLSGSSSLYPTWFSVSSGIAAFAVLIFMYKKRH
jgi:hypothetical protein